MALTNIDFDLGTLAGLSAYTLSVLPTLQVHQANASTGSHVDCSFNWSKSTASGQGNWENFMSYTSNDDDLTDASGIVATDDITYFTFKSEWYTGNYMSETPLDGLHAGTGPGVITSGSYTPTSIGDELTLHIGKSIFGSVGGLDMLSNEEAFTANVKSESFTQLSASIDGLLNTASGSDAGGTVDAPGGNSGNTLINNQNFAYKILAQIMSVENRKLDAIAKFVSGSGTTSGTHQKMPFIAGDTITFTIAITPTFNFSDTVPASNNHGIGNNGVPERKYKIKLVLTNT
jgi:hypothetical protein